MSGRVNRWQTRPRNVAIAAAAVAVMVCGAIWPMPIVGAGGALIAAFALYAGIRQMIAEHREARHAAAVERAVARLRFLGEDPAADLLEAWARGEHPEHDPDDEPDASDDDQQPAERCSVCGDHHVIHQTVTPARLCGDCFLCRCGETPCVRTGINDPAVSGKPRTGDNAICACGFDPRTEDEHRPGCWTFERPDSVSTEATRQRADTCGPDCAEGHTYAYRCALKPPPMDPRQILGIDPGFGSADDPQTSGPDPDAVRTDPDTTDARPADQPGHDPDGLAPAQPNTPRCTATWPTHHYGTFTCWRPANHNADKPPLHAGESDRGWRFTWLDTDSNAKPHQAATRTEGSSR